MKPCSACCMPFRTGFAICWSSGRAPASQICSQSCGQGPLGSRLIREPPTACRGGSRPVPDLTKVVAIETADHGITCNAICPGWVMTPLVAQQVEARANAAGQSFDETKREFVAEKQPMARYTRPEDIGALAVFLAGDAADTITGASYSIDGGWTAQ